MGGFKNESNNIDFEQNLFNLIVIHIAQCCKKMQKDCETTGNYLYNHENKISNRLVAEYLDLNILGIRFRRETPAHYDAKTHMYKGRTDITVMSSDWLNNPDVYYVIECKRLDGEADLNRKYVSKGISRFILLPGPKYSSYCGKSIMLGYVVQTINVCENTKKIDKLQRELFTDVTISEMRLVCDDEKGFNHYQCLYQTSCDLNVEITHLFYDFSDVMHEES